MTNKLTISISLAGVLVGLAAWLFPLPPSPNALNNVVVNSSLASATPTILVSGTGAQLKILKGSNDTEFYGANITQTSADSTVYIRPGQKIVLELTGTGAKVLVQSGLMQYIKIHNSATGGSIHEL